jgi:hypothetical protein
MQVYLVIYLQLLSEPPGVGVIPTVGGRHLLRRGAEARNGSRQAEG